MFAIRKAVICALPPQPPLHALQLGIGPHFAPLASRSVSSEGEITADGLRPHRYCLPVLKRETHRIALVVGQMFNFIARQIQLSEIS